MRSTRSQPAPVPPPIDAVGEALAAIQASGTFATRLSAAAADLEIEVEGVGRLGLPVKPRTVRALLEVAQASPFGLGERTVHDPSVRCSLEIPGRRVKIAARRWKPALAKHLEAIRAALGLPEGQRLEAVLDKLVLYEEGQFFKAHQDSERDDRMVATLVVVLPSEYEGGSLTVEHRGEKKRFHRLSGQSRDLSLLAFYADCRHEVRPVETGVRVTLTYHLLAGEPGERAAPSQGAAVDRLLEMVRVHFETPIPGRLGAAPAPPERLVYLLDHEYSQRSLSWDRLKSGDRARVGALRAVAARLGCELFLALAEVHESWTCEDAFDERYRYRRGRYHDHDDDLDEDDGGGGEDYELGSLEDESIVLTHWLDTSGRRSDGIGSEVESQELCFTRPSAELDPFRSEHEGYQGNYGNTVDRWYHRAALVMWPRERTFALRARASPEWALDELTALDSAAHGELEARIRTLLPRWRETAAKVESARFFERLFKLATRIEDPALTRDWLAPAGAQRLGGRAARADLVTLVGRHGAAWGQTLFGAWAERAHWRTPEWLPALADVCEALVGSEREPCTSLGRWLVESEARRALERCTSAIEHRQEPWLDLEKLQDEAQHVVHVLAAAAVVPGSSALEDLTARLSGEQPAFPTSLLVHALEQGLARSHALGERLVDSDLHRTCVARLEAVVNGSPRAADDWAIRHALTCRCEDCRELTAFLVSPGRNRDWPLRKERRQHLHGVIDGAGLPVSHVTLRKGSPQVLQLRKTAELFSRERQHRKEVAARLALLRAPRGAARSARSAQATGSRGRARRIRP